MESMGSTESTHCYGGYEYRQEYRVLDKTLGYSGVRSTLEYRSPLGGKGLSILMFFVDLSVVRAGD